MQKMLGPANRLPQPGMTEEGAELQDARGKAISQLTKLIQSLTKVQDHLLSEGSWPHDDNEEEDEEIPSDDELSLIDEDEEDEEKGDDEDEDIDEEDDDQDEGSGEDEPQKPLSAPKLQPSAPTIVPSDPLKIPNALLTRSTAFKRKRDEVLEDWYQKTRFSVSGVGGKSGKNMDSFETSPVVQVNQILSDKKRLIKRTQLKRSDYEVIGKKEEEEKEDVDEDDELIAKKSTNHRNVYDPEIFDDDDFYHQMLRELISTKTSSDGDGAMDSISLSRKWLEIQKMRSKMKKKVDTRASKGRKIRFETHKELVNFMAPVINRDMTDGAKDDFFSSLFQ